jgi:hypothetical protein
MKPIASLSLDLDNQWSYMKTHGDAGWETFPSYLDLVVPRILDVLKRKGLTITFFVVGRDASLDKNRDAIASIASAGHEIANHSFDHEPYLHLYSKDELIEEFEKTEHAIFDATGKRTVGFRGPGFSLSPTVIEVLGERGYEYDCSTLPTFIGPLARLFYFFKSPDVSDEEREKLKKLFGKFSDGFRSLNPHYVEAGGRSLVEIPVTTFPGIKTPIHATYLLYLASFSTPAAKAYWKSAVSMCRLMGVQPSLLLHPLDFLSGEDIDELKFFPGMNLPTASKMDLLESILDTYLDKFTVLTMREHANHFHVSDVSTEVSREHALQ